MSLLQFETIINQATSSLGNYQNLIKDRLIFLANRSPWFKSTLIYVLKKGLKITVEDTLSGGFFEGLDNRLSIRKEFLNSTIPKEILLEKLSVTLRHELTHALDWADLNIAPTNRTRFFTKSASNRHLANIIFNKLNCIYTTKSINANILNDLTKLIAKVRSVNNYLILSTNDNYSELFNDLLNNLGSCFNPQMQADPFNVFITKFYMVSNSTTIYEQTADLVQVQSNFNKTSSIRHFYNKTHFEDLFYKTFDSEQQTLWETLTQNQRKALNSLFHIRRGILAHVGRDSICYPKFVSCVSNLENDCLLDLLSCQKGEYQQLSYFEMNAILQEGLDSHLIDIKNFEEICKGDDLYYFKTSRERTSALMSISGCLAFCFISSFIDKQTVSFLANNEVAHPALYRSLINVYIALIPALIFLIYGEENTSVFWTLAIPITLALLKTFVDHSPNNKKPTFFKTAVRYCLSTLTVASVITSHSKWEALGTLGSGIVGSMTGEIVGKSISNWFQPAKIQFQETLEPNQDEMFESKKIK